MLTPQEVASHAFPKATLGGYNMAMVDEFLDLLTEDYTALYNDNAILKNKLKVLSETIEEYRATDNAMRKTLLAAQQMAESIVNEAEQKRQVLVREAEQSAAERIDELKKSVAAEEYRLQQAKAATAAYVSKLKAFHDEEVAFLSQLGELVPPEESAQDNTMEEITASVSALVFAEEAEEEEIAEEPVAVEEEEPAPAEEDEDLDPVVTRRFTDLKFGRDYEIK